MVINEINNALYLAQEFAQKEPSRELSLAITKLEEASHWAEALRRKMEALEEMKVKNAASSAQRR